MPPPAAAPDRAAFLFFRSHPLHTRVRAVRMCAMMPASAGGGADSLAPGLRLLAAPSPAS